MPEPPAEKPARRPLSGRFLDGLERAGNRLPQPATLFVLFSAAVVLLSAAASGLGLHVKHPTTGEEIHVVNLLSVAGLHKLLTSLVTNFTSFAPLGTVLVATLGIAVAEGSGLIRAAMKATVLAAPRRLLTAVVVFAGVMSNMASDIGYVLLIPLSAALFLAVGRHPLAGLAASFAGVSGGFSANLLIGTIDPLLAGITQEAAHLVDPAYTVNAAANYYFLFASTFLVTLVGTVVTERVVEPRLGAYRGDGAPEAIESLSRAERRGLLFALAAAAAFAGLLLWGTVPADGFLRDPKTGSLLHSPFLSGIVALLFAGGVLTGVAYGVGAGTVRGEKDVLRPMAKSMETLATYLVLVFFAAQFIALFGWTRLGLVVAVEGANGLKAAGFGGVPLLVSFVLLTAGVNLLMASASAKWALMAPVFVPMFMLLGYSPETAQAAYRVGDSAANVVTPLLSYFPLIVAFAQKYEPKAGMGTLIATMLPYTVALLFAWTLLLAVWYLLGIPLGPGAEIYYPAR